MAAGLAWLLAACGSGDLPVITASLAPAATATPTGTPTAIPPTPTPIPLAARVNGEAITLAEFQAELARFQAAGVEPLPAEEALAGERVLQELIDQVLLAQAAREAGFTLDEAAVQARRDELAARAGGEQALADWMATNGYTEETFRTALARGAAAAWMRDRIAETVPEAAEQAHARQILLRDSAEAAEIYAALQAGADFATLAASYDPVGLGDLGWFPRGYLLEPALEEAAFSLEPEAYSPVIETRLGFHILQVIERRTNRPLDPEARLALQKKALQAWMADRRSQSEIEILLTD